MEPLFVLTIVLVLISFFAILGAVLGYIFLSTIKGNMHQWELFSGYLMVLFSGAIVLLVLAHRPMTLLTVPQVFSGFVVGALILTLVMRFHDGLSGSTTHRHAQIGVILFFMLALHELIEGFTVAELFHNISAAVAFEATLIPLMVLALHEIPEGLVLVVPFFLAKQIRNGIVAALANQALFVGAGYLSYYILSQHIVLSVAKEAFVTTIPAGGIFALGILDLKRIAASHKGRFRIVPSPAFMLLSALVLVGTIISLRFAQYHVGHHVMGISSGTEINPETGESIPVIYADPCEHEVNIEHCISH